MDEKIETAIRKLQTGNMIFIYDGGAREGETDMVMLAKCATQEAIRFMRKRGGLICIAVAGKVAEKMKLPFFADLLLTGGLEGLLIPKTPYGDKSAFSLTLNHRNTYTGITDIDRARTISEFGKLADSLKTENRKPETEFHQKFYSPGHVYVLIGRGLEKRKGHTELSLALAEKCGSNATVICELLGDDGKALKPEEAEKLADENGSVLLSGKKIIEFAGENK